MMHMKCRDLFSLKNKKKIFFECRLLQILLGTLWVEYNFNPDDTDNNKIGRIHTSDYILNLFFQENEA